MKLAYKVIIGLLILSIMLVLPFFLFGYESNPSFFQRLPFYGLIGVFVFPSILFMVWIGDNLSKR